MKKQMAVLFAALCLFSGCAAQNSAQDLEQQLEQVTAQRDVLQSQLDDMQNSTQDLQKQLDHAIAQRDALQSQLEEMIETQPEMDAIVPDRVIVSVTGTFTATVRSLIPNYVVDGTTPMMAVVTPFQSSPFILNTRDQTANLTAGETYVFTVESAQVEISKEEYEKGVPLPEKANALYGLNVLSVAPAGEGDSGLDSIHLEFATKEYYYQNGPSPIE